MSSWLIVFAVVAYVSLTTALPLKDNSVPEEPEHVIQKRQLEALNEFFDGRLCEYGVPILERKLENIEIPDQREGRLRISRIDVTRVNIGRCLTEFSGSVTNPSVRIRLSDITLTVTGRYRYKKWFLRFSGGWTVNVNSAHVDVTATATVDVDSLRVTRLTVNNCDDDFTNVNVRFHGSISAWILNFFKGRFSRSLSKKVEDKVCEIGTPYLENELL